MSVYAKEDDPYIDFDIPDEEEDLYEYDDIESPDDFVIYHRDDYTVAYPANFFRGGYSNEQAAEFWQSHRRRIMPAFLEYSFENNTYSSIKEASNAIYDDIGKARLVKKIIVNKPEEGRLIFSGRRESLRGAPCSFYYLANITEEHIYTMEIALPLTSDKNEALHMAYIIDCLYRYCSFNGSQREEKPIPRDYDDFVESGEYDIELLMKE